MDPRTAPHPTDEVLSAYGLGKLADAPAESVHRHLEGCEACRRRVAEQSSDSFLGRVRAAKTDGQTAAAGRPSVVTSRAGMPRPRQSPPPAPPGSIPPGLASHADYENIRELGRGGMGVVYLAHNRLMGRDEVLKVMGKHLVDRPGVLDRFLREIRAVANLRHVNIVSAYSAFRLDDGIVFAMEYVDGFDLSRMVKTRGPLPVAHACHFAHQAALGLQHAFERDLVHRDIKPHNLMVSREGDKAVVKVLDFGLAKATREGAVDSALTHEGQALGTPDYIAPEQILDAPNADTRADVYSLGATLYCLLTGKPPFTGSSLYDLYQAHISTDAKPLNIVRPEVPSELAALVAKMLAKEPARRFQTPGEVADALKPFFKKAAARPAPASKPETPAAPTPRKPTPAAPVEAGVTTIESLPPAPTAVSLASLGLTEVDEESVGVPASAGRRWAWASVAAGVLAAAFAAAWFGGVIKVKTSAGTVVLEGYPEGAEVLVDGDVVTVDLPGGGGPAEVRVKPGRHGVEVKRAGFRTFGQEVTLTDGGTVVLKVSLFRYANEKDRAAPEPAPPARANAEPPARGRAPSMPDPPASPPRPDTAVASYEPLFNGRDLDGWEVRGNPKAVWNPVNGMLRGTWPDDDVTGGSTLTTVRKDYRNFRLRFEARPCKNWASYAVFKQGRGRWHLAAIGVADGRDVDRVGTVHRSTQGEAVAASVSVRLRPNQVVTQEVVVEGNRMRVFVDRILVSDYRSDDLPGSGAIGFHLTGGSAMLIRNVEVMRLPDDLKVDAKGGEADAQVKAAPAVSIPLFNGKDLAGWRGGRGALWARPDDVVKAEDGDIVFSAAQGDAVIGSIRGYRDYSLEFEFKWPAEGSDPPQTGLVLLTNNADDSAWNGLEFDLRPGTAGRFAAYEHSFTIETLTAEQPRFAAAVDRPRGEWNSAGLRCKGGRLAFELNGALVNEHEFPRSVYGPVGFRTRGADFRVRNVRLSPLDPTDRDGATTHDPRTVVGDWEYSLVDVRNTVITLKPDGTVKRPSRPSLQDGDWLHSGSLLIIRWPTADPNAGDGIWYDRLRLSDDGQRFHGTNQLKKAAISGVRVGG